MRNGERINGKFVERRGKFVKLDCVRLEMRHIAAMGYALTPASEQHSPAPSA